VKVKVVWKRATVSLKMSMKLLLLILRYLITISTDKSLKHTLPLLNERYPA